MPDYEVPEPTAGGELPDPDAVPSGGGELGNKVLLAVGVVQLLAGLVLLVAWMVAPLPIVGAALGLGFFVFGVLLLIVVANARLAARFRSEEYRDRLRSLRVPDSEE